MQRRAEQSEESRAEESRADERRAEEKREEEIRGEQSRGKGEQMLLLCTRSHSYPPDATTARALARANTTITLDMLGLLLRAAGIRPDLAR